MAHGGHRKHKVAGKPMHNSKGLGVKRALDKANSKKKTKAASIKNQIRSIERLLKKNLPSAAQDVQKQRLEDLKKQAEEHQRAELERKMSLRYRRVKFFERRKIERRIKHLEKLLEGTDAADAAMKENPDVNKHLVQLREDLEYVRFFPRTEKYVSLFVGDEDDEVLPKRSKLREQIKANLAAAAALGVEPDDIDDDKDPAMAVSDDDFFLAESASDTAEAGDPFNFTSSTPGSVRNQTSKNIAILSAKHSSASKKHQFSKISHNAGLGSKFHMQGVGPMLKNKDNQRHYPVSADNKIKVRKVDDHTHHSIIKNNKLTKGMGSQALKFEPHSSSLSETHSRSQQARSQPASSLSQSHNKSQQARNAESSVIASKNNADSFSVPSHVSAEAIKEPKYPEFGSSSMHVPKKRHRKHRPKKRKA